MNLEQWQQVEYTGMKPGLARIRGFLKRIGNPQESFKTVHIAGTNGKGSTAAVTESILRSAGYKTGLYTSPHLVTINERIRVNGVPIPGRELDAIVKKYGGLARKFSLSFFEFITAAAFVYFRRIEVDIAVLETGLGGRFDATNVIRRPLVSIITDIDYDHCALLGKTLPAIAREKAGIIKGECPVIVGSSRSSAVAVLRAEARRKRSKVFQISRDFIAESSFVNWRGGRQKICYKGNKGRFWGETPLLGQHQVRNVALAIAAAEIIDAQGGRIPDRAVREGLAVVRWPGRFDVRHIALNGCRKTVVLDGAHNPGGMARFIETWKKTPWAAGRHSFIFGVLADKGFEAMVKTLAGAARRLILVPVASRRTLAPEALFETCRKYLPSEKIVVVRSLSEALAVSGKGPTAITGSLYLIGEFMRSETWRTSILE